MNVFFELLLAYLLYRFIVGFLVPLLQTTRQMRQQFQDMNNRSGAGGTGPHPNPPGKPSPGRPDDPKNRADSMGEYIDFEEVK